MSHPNPHLLEELLIYGPSDAQLQELFVIRH